MPATTWKDSSSWKCGILTSKVTRIKDAQMVLSRTAWLNIKVDLLAKSRIDTQHQAKQGYRLPNKPRHLEICGLCTAKHPKHSLKNALNRPPAQQYWKTKMPNLSPSLAELDTDATKQAMWETPAHKWQWVTKHITGQFAHRKNMQRQGQWSLAQCPRCSNKMEDNSTFYDVQCLEQDNNGKQV